MNKINDPRIRAIADRCEPHGTITADRVKPGYIPPTPVSKIACSPTHVFRVAQPTTTP